MKKKTKTAGYQVGFGKPPRETQYRPGISGNPKGRPKGSLNLNAALQRELRKPVVINEHGQRRTISLFEAALKQLATKAATGDMHALKLLLTLIRAGEEQEVVGTSDPIDLTETDQKLVQNALKRMNRYITGESK